MIEIMRRIIAAALLHCASQGSTLKAPFAKTALGVADLESLRACEQVPYENDGQDGCENPHGAILAWNYALRNARRQLDAVRALEELSDEDQELCELLSDLVQAFIEDIGEFLDDENPDRYYQELMGNIRKFFDERLSPWLSDHMEEVEITLEDPILVKGAQALFASRGPAPVASLRGASLANATVELTSEVEMPLVGFGTWQLEADECSHAVMWALATGYKHIDTAQGYANEDCVGSSLRDSGMPRHSIFLATKLSEEEDYTAKGVLKAFAEQLNALKTSYLDLYMLHGPGETPEQTIIAWRALEQLYEQGQIKALGVSNFGLEQLRHLIEHAKVNPVYIQNKLSIYTHAEDESGELLPFLRTNGIALVGYSVINPWPFVLEPLRDAHVLSVADRYGRSPSQVLHRWALQFGAAVLPKSAQMTRIEENANLFNFDLSEQDMALLSGLANMVNDIEKRVGADDGEEEEESMHEETIGENAGDEL